MSEPIDNDSGRVVWDFRDTTDYTFDQTQFNDANEKFCPNGLVLEPKLSGQEEIDDSDFSDWYDQGEMEQYPAECLYGVSGGLLWDIAVNPNTCTRGGMGMAGASNGVSGWRFSFRLKVSSGTPTLVLVSKAKPPFALVQGIQNQGGIWYWWNPAYPRWEYSGFVSDDDWHIYNSTSDGLVSDL